MQKHWEGGGNTKPESLRSECVEVTANLSRYVQTRGSYAGSKEPARQCSRLETQVQSLGWEDLLEDSMATHSRILRLENTTLLGNGGPLLVPPSKLEDLHQGNSIPHPHGTGMGN